MFATRFWALAIFSTLLPLHGRASQIPWDGVFAVATSSQTGDRETERDPKHVSQIGAASASAQTSGLGGYASSSVVLFDDRYVANADAIFHPRTVMHLSGAAQPDVFNSDEFVENGVTAGADFIEKLRLLVPNDKPHLFDERIHLTGTGSSPTAGGTLVALVKDASNGLTFGADSQNLLGNANFDTHTFGNLALPAGQTDIEIDLFLNLGATDGGYFNYSDTLETDLTLDPEVQVLGSASGLFPVYRSGSDTPLIAPQLAELATGGFGPPVPPPSSAVPEPATYELLALGLGGWSVVSFTKRAKGRE